MDGTYLYTRTHRTARAAEWSAGKIVTFIVTLASTRTVTLAARAAGMSRKAAYALRQRDPAFRAAWDAAMGVGRGDAAARRIVNFINPPVTLGPRSGRRATPPPCPESVARLDRFHVQPCRSPRRPP